MKRARYSWSPNKIADRIRRGYGEGTLASYIPWIGVRDLSSKGTSSRMWSPKTGRKMQFLSNIERDTFLTAEFREDFVDYWEQWPLKRELSMRAARSFGYRHPIYVGTKIPVVMTVDGVLTQMRNGNRVKMAIDCKHSDDLSARQSARTLQKLAIARAACKRENLRHVLVTEKEINPTVVKNILWIRAAVPKTGEIQPVSEAFTRWPRKMHHHLTGHQTDPAFANLPVNAYCKWFDGNNSLPRGLGLRCIKILMWHHAVELDMRTPKPEKLRLSTLTVRPSYHSMRRPIACAANSNP